MRDFKAVVFRKYPRPPEVQVGKQAKWFIVRNSDGLRILKYWLMIRKYNAFTEGLDAQGNTLLNLTYKSTVLHVRQCSKDRGVIAVWEKTLIKPVIALLEDLMV